MKSRKNQRKLKEIYEKLKQASRTNEVNTEEYKKVLDKFNGNNKEATRNA